MRNPSGTERRKGGATKRGRRGGTVSSRGTPGRMRKLFAILLPPVSVFVDAGLGRHFWLNLLLTLLGYIPGVVHALWRLRSA